MTFSSPLALALALAGGSALGLLYFGGLWQTVLRVATVRHPGALALTSALVRGAIALAGFWVIMSGRLDRLLAAMAGFFLMRTLLIRRLGLGPRDAARLSNQDDR